MGSECEIKENAGWSRQDHKRIGFDATSICVFKLQATRFREIVTVAPQWKLTPSRTWNTSVSSGNETTTMRETSASCVVGCMNTTRTRSWPRYVQPRRGRQRPFSASQHHTLDLRERDGPFVRVARVKRDPDLRYTAGGPGMPKLLSSVRARRVS